MICMAADLSRPAGWPERPRGDAAPSSRGGPDPEPSDAELARRARSGDRGAFARLYERFAPAVHGVLLASAPLGEARDLVQEVFLAALGGIGALDEPERVGPWLCTIARNRAKDAHKRRRGAVELAQAPEPAVEDAAPGDDEEEAELALRALRALPEAYRETLALRLVEGLSGPEIAARTGLTHGSVRVNLHRGMKLLRDELERGGGR